MSGSVSGTVVVTGAGGQLGRELMRAAWPEHVAVHGFDSTGLDITDHNTMHRVMEMIAPSVIVNAAAFTSVDSAESSPDAAMSINAAAVGALAEVADRLGSFLVQVSTDYVFDGNKDGWYNEEDHVAPTSLYGESKLKGETAALRNERSVVLRTSWLYGALGSNFVTTMLRIAAERERIDVVDDQIGCPTAARALADAIVDVVMAAEMGNAKLPRDLYHLAGPEAMSWYGFAQSIFALSSAGFDGECYPIETAGYPTPANRPANSRLDSSLIAHDLGITMPPFQESLADVINELEK